MWVLTAFEPFSLALAASLFETACIHSPRRTTVPRARIWLRRQARPLLSSLLQEGTEPVLDGVLNHLPEPRVCAAALVLFLLAGVLGTKLVPPSRAWAVPHALVLLLLLSLDFY